MSEHASTGAAEHGHGDHHAVIEAEPDATNIKVLGATLVVFLILHFSALAGLWVYFQRANESAIEAQVLARPSEELKALRASEAQVLGGYGVVDAAAGVYQVPVERAIDLFVADARAMQDSGRPVRMGAAPAAAAAPVEGAAPAAPAAPAAAPAVPAPAPAAPAPAPGGSAK